MNERDFLHRHGTELVAITPGMVVQGALRDLQVRSLKRQFDGLAPPLLPEAASPSKSVPVIAPTHQYLFHRKHVMRAKTAEQLLTLALADRDIGCQSAKHHTRMIYGDPDLLRDALVCARGGRPTEDETRMFEIYQALAGTPESAT
jgi:hypothetical protein